MNNFLSTGARRTGPHDLSSPASGNRPRDRSAPPATPLPRHSSLFSHLQKTLTQLVVRRPEIVLQEKTQELDRLLGALLEKLHQGKAKLSDCQRVQVAARALIDATVHSNGANLNGSSSCQPEHGVLRQSVARIQANTSRASSQKLEKLAFVLAALSSDNAGTLMATVGNGDGAVLSSLREWAGEMFHEGFRQITELEAESIPVLLRCADALTKIGFFDSGVESFVGRVLMEGLFRHMSQRGNGLDCSWITSPTFANFFDSGLELAAANLEEPVRQILSACLPQDFYRLGKELMQCRLALATESLLHFPSLGQPQIERKFVQNTLDAMATVFLRKFGREVFLNDVETRDIGVLMERAKFLKSSDVFISVSADFEAALMPRLQVVALKPFSLLMDAWTKQRCAMAEPARSTDALLEVETRHQFSNALVQISLLYDYAADFGKGENFLEQQFYSHLQHKSGKEKLEFLETMEQPLPATFMNPHYVRQSIFFSVASRVVDADNCALR